MWNPCRPACKFRKRIDRTFSLFTDYARFKTYTSAKIFRGGIKTVRSQKYVTFVELNDGSCFQNIQIVIEPTLPKFQDIFPQLTIGASRSVIGVIVMAPSQGPQQKIEVNADRISILGENLPESYVLQKKRHSFEFLRTIVHLRPRTNTFGAQSSKFPFICNPYFFQEQGLLYVQTPIITSTDCEGAGEMLQVTTLDINKPPRDKAGLIDWS
ncbi:hypothetical protein ACTFIW_003730 [Dictyostelium discoideum]